VLTVSTVFLLNHLQDYFNRKS